MTWNYRIIRRRDSRHFALHEVYYDAEGKPLGMTENPVTFVVDADASPHEIITALRFALRDVEWPVLDESEVWPGQALGDDSAPAGRAALAAEGE